MAQVARAQTEAAGGPEHLKRLSVQFRGMGVPEQELVVTSTVREVARRRRGVDAEARQGDTRLVRRGEAEVDPLLDLDGVLTAASGAAAREGDRRLRGDRPARRLEGARRRPATSPPGRRRSATSSPCSRSRACSRIRTPRPAASPTDAGYRYYVDRCCRAPQRRARAGARADARAPRGRRGDAADDRDALAGHRPAGDRLRAADPDDDDPPRRGAAAPAAGADGRDHHLDRRRLQARCSPTSGPSTPGSPTGRRPTSTRRSSARASARARCARG